MGPTSGTRTTTKRWLLPAAVAGAAALVLSACGGSTLNPRDVALANSGVQPGTAAASGGGGASTGITTTGGSTGTDVVGTGGSAIGSSGTGSNATTGSGTGGSATTGNPGNGTSTGGGAPATGGKAGSCAGFKNQTGVDDSTIKIGNVVDVSGPIPGFFTASQLATKAYVAYFNSTSNLCGRKFEVVPYDSQTNASGDQVGAQKACEQTLAQVGSMAGFDSGGAATTQRCGLPDLRAIQTNAARTACTTCFSAEGPGNGKSPTAVPRYFLKNHHDLTQHAAMFYVGEAASVSNALGQEKAETSVGYKFVYSAQFDIAEFNYAPYVQRMKQAGVRLVQMYGSDGMAVRMAQAMQAADFHPQLLLNAAIYTTGFASAGSATEGTIIYIDFAPIEEVASNPEMALYNRWLQQVSPGAKMSYFGLFSWSATRLFVQRAVALGGKLSRPNLIASIKQVHSWSSNGLHPSMDVGGKAPSTCWRFIQLHNGKWIPYGGTRYTCAGYISSK